MPIKHEKYFGIQSNDCTRVESAIIDIFKCFGMQRYHAVSFHSLKFNSCRRILTVWFKDLKNSWYYSQSLFLLARKKWKLFISITRYVNLLTPKKKNRNMCTRLASKCAYTRFINIIWPFFHSACLFFWLMTFTLFCLLTVFLWGSIMVIFSIQRLDRTLLTYSAYLSGKK